MKFCFRQITDKLTWIAFPILASWNQPTWRNYSVVSQLRPSLDDATFSNDTVVSDHHIVINDTAINSAIRPHLNVLANVGTRRNVHRQRDSCENVGPLANGRKVSDSDGVEFSPQ